MSHLSGESLHARIRLTFALALGIVSALGALIVLDPGLLTVAWARPLAGIQFVSNVNDSGAGSLRDALVAAGAGDFIIFSLGANPVITLTSGPLTVTQPVQIVGTTANNLSVSGDHTFRVFSVTAPSTFLGFTIRDGDTGGDGGGLFSTVPVTLTVMQFVSNTASNGGGAYVAGDAALIVSTFTDNRATGVVESLATDFEDGVPAGWSSGASGAASVWTLSNSESHSGIRSDFTGDPSNVGESWLATPSVPVGVAGGILSFWLEYETEGGFDGAALEININGAGFTDIITRGGTFLSNGYNGVLGNGSGNPIGGREAWHGNSNGFHKVQVLLPPAATGQNVQFRWRMGSDNSTGGNGVWLDDVALRVPAFGLGYGGGLYVNETLALTLTQFLSNSAVYQAGGAYGELATTVSGGLFQNNRSVADLGGGLYADHTLIISGTQFISNTAGTFGGGAFASAATAVNAGLFQSNHSTQDGGGLFANDALTLTNTQFLSNTANGSNGGGGAYANLATTVSGGLFQNNQSANGGGLYVFDALTLSGTQFMSNTVNGLGGGAYTFYGAAVNGGLFENNRSTGSDGGGLYVHDALALTGTQFLSNTALTYGGGAYAKGLATFNGGLFRNNSNTDPLGGGGGLYGDAALMLTGTQFISNTASGKGGGAAAKGATRMVDGLFQGNASTASNGGGLAVQNSMSLSGTQFFSNQADGDGAGAFAAGAAALTGTLYVDNHATFSGGGLAAYGVAMVTDTQFLSNTAGNYGGGIYLFDPAAVTNALFQNNSSNSEGGGLRANGALNVRASVFRENHSGSGGGLSAFAPAAVTSTLFVSNSATAAGGGLSASNTLTLSDTQFISNTAGGNGGGASMDNATLTNVKFQNNSSSADGGGLNAGVIALTNGLFQNNSGRSGGGLYASSLTLTGTTFLSNTASAGGNGGGAGVEGGATLNGGLFQNNQATAFGGGISVDGALALTGTQFIANAAAGGNGGALYHSSGDGRIVNALFARNDGSVLYLASPGSVQILHTTIASPTLSSGFGILGITGTIGISDSIIANQQICIGQSSGTMYEDYNLLYGDTLPVNGHVIPGGHNPSGDPRFVNPAADNYHLVFPSAAIDTGTNVGVTRDADGDVRPQDGGFDIGYDEFTGVLLRLFLPAIMR